MRSVACRFAALLLISIGLLFPFPAKAYTSPKGTVTSTGTSKNNSDTAVPFALVGSSKVSIQCDAAAYVLAVDAAGGTVTAANGVLLAAGQLYDEDLPAGTWTGNGKVAFVAVISVAGTANCKVFYRV